MRLIDVSVPLDATLPTYPHNTPFSLEPVKRLASGDASIPAGRIRRDMAVVLADRAAASNISATETKGI